MSDIPKPVPVRMVNEFEYCPRLFYLEWVQARFEDNPDTVEGRYVHRRVDLGGGRVGESSEDEPVRVARSVTLGSERLGLTAKADIIERSSDGSVVPVEVKRRRPPAHGPAWSPELVQSAIGLLLQDNGYNCTKGQIFFAETRRRVTIPFDEDLVAKTLSVVDQLRPVAAAPDPPPPLVDSPKCPRCSLVGICLPDETNLHTRRSASKPRRLTPRDSAARPLYITQQGAKVGIAGGRVRDTLRNKELQQVRAIDVSQIPVFGNVQLSSQLMRAAFSRQVPDCWFSYGGRLQGVAHGLPSKHVELRRRQVAIAGQASLPIARRLVEGKIRNSRTFLRRNSRADTGPVLPQLKGLAGQTAAVESVESLLGLEGTAARLYFRRFAGMLKNDELGTLDFNGRNRRPPRDPADCLLSYAYSLRPGGFGSSWQQHVGEVRGVGRLPHHCGSSGPKMLTSVSVRSGESEGSPTIAARSRSP